jgi:hypothetical protein
MTWRDARQPKDQFSGEQFIALPPLGLQHSTMPAAPRACYRTAKQACLVGRNPKIKSVSASWVLAGSAINDATLGFVFARLMSRGCCLHLMPPRSVAEEVVLVYIRGVRRNCMAKVSSNAHASDGVKAQMQGKILKMFGNIRIKCNGRYTAYDYRTW